MRTVSAMLFVILVAGCQPAPTGTSSTPPGPPSTTAPDPEAVFGPLEVGADWASYHKVSKHPFPSKTHGGRFVEVYVNDVGHAAYISDAEFPVGTVIVKTSWESEGGVASDVPGPIFVMRKEKPGYSPEHNDWYYAIHWEHPAPKWNTQPLYWRGLSHKVDYCRKCHDDYDREIGGVPQDARAW